MNRRIAFSPAAALVAGPSLLGAAAQADAHAHLVSATPAANSTGPAPPVIMLQFSERLAPPFSGFDLMKSDGGRVKVETSVPVNDRKMVHGVVTGRLAPGTYMVMWHVVAASDGHRTAGDYNFSIR